MPPCTSMQQCGSPAGPGPLTVRIFRSLKGSFRMTTARESCLWVCGPRQTSRRKTRCSSVWMAANDALDRQLYFAGADHLALTWAGRCNLLAADGSSPVRQAGRIGVDPYAFVRPGKFRTTHCADHGGSRGPGADRAHSRRGSDGPPSPGSPPLYCLLRSDRPPLHVRQGHSRAYAGAGTWL